MSQPQLGVQVKSLGLMGSRRSCREWFRTALSLPPSGRSIALNIFVQICSADIFGHAPVLLSKF